MNTFKVKFRRCVCITGWLTDVAPHDKCPRCSTSAAVLDLPGEAGERAVRIAWEKEFGVRR